MNDNIITRELTKCFLCYDAPCSNKCPNGINPDKIIRSLRFLNYDGAYNKLNDSCLECSAPCEKACISGLDFKIKEVLSTFIYKKKENKFDYKKVDIKSDICGIEIENPFLLSSSVVSSSYDMCKRAFEAGWAGAAFKTICLMDIKESSPRYSALLNSDGTIAAFKNIEQLSENSVDENLKIFKKLKEEFPNKFLLVSIMGKDDEEWKYLAQKAEEAGADALELNFSCPNMAEDGTGSDVGEIPLLIERFTKVVTKSVKIPVIAKLTPNVNEMSPMAIAAKRGGAKGIAAINTIKSITDLNLLEKIFKKKQVNKISVGGLSGASVKPIAIRFISELAQNKELSGLHLSAMGGIYNYEDALIFLSLGAKSIQITTAVMEYGYRIIDDLKEGLQYFIHKNNYDSLNDLFGINIDTVVDKDEMDRDHIIYPKFLKDNCINCGRCYISCMDGGHQAIEFKNRIPTLNPKRCVGCHLCVIVCPNNAIISSDIKIKK